jgi:hypothetical protein
MTSRKASISAIVSRADNDGDPSPIDATQHSNGFTSNGPSRPVDQHFRRIRGLRIDRRHLRGGDDRDHDASATTIA